MTDTSIVTSASATDALAHASADVPTTRTNESAGDLLHRMIGAARYDSVADVAVLDGVRLVGMVPIEHLLAAPPATSVADLMDPDPPTIGPGEDQEAAAATAVSHHESSLGVVDSSGRFMGMIPPNRMLGVLLEEHREDMARMSGYLHHGEQARSASEERLVLRFWHRFPWLLVGLAAALAAAAIVGSFERGLAEHLELAFFIPGVVYIAGAVGNQTVTLLVRGLSVGVPVGRVVRRELVTGMALGVVLGSISYPAVRLWFDADIALVLASSIGAASTVATGIAVVLPWAFSALRLDPAFGSGPMATVVQDLVSLAIYFAFATLLVL